MSNFQEKEPSDLFASAYTRLKKANKLKLSLVNIFTMLVIIALIVVVIEIIAK